MCLLQHDTLGGTGRPGCPSPARLGCSARGAELQCPRSSLPAVLDAARFLLTQPCFPSRESCATAVPGLGIRINSLGSFLSAAQR